MPLTQAPDPSKLEPTLYGLSVDELKWYAAFLPGKSPTRKAELIALLLGALTNPEQIQQLYSQLPSAHQHTIAEVIHTLGGRCRTIAPSSSASPRSRARTSIA
jgi:hypothetical protein